MDVTAQKTVSRRPVADGTPPGFACLPMYDFVELRADHAQLWTLMRIELTAAGLENLAPYLFHTCNPVRTWRDPGLLFSQTCGYPLVTQLRHRVRLIATPCYDVEGCQGSRYRSWLVTRIDEPGDNLSDFHGRRLVINEPASLSGCKVLEMLLPAGQQLETFFNVVLRSGAHTKSLEYIARGEADLAAIDCVTWGLLERFRPAQLKGLRIVDAGPSLPALPFITTLATTDYELDTLRTALQQVLNSTSFTRHQNRLAFRGVSVLDESVYGEILRRLERD